MKSRRWRQMSFIAAPTAWKGPDYQLLIDRVSPHFSALKASRLHTPAIGKLLAIRVSEDYQTKVRNTLRYRLGLPYGIYEDTYLST